MQENKYSYLETETSFEDTVRRCMLSGRESWLAGEERTPEALRRISMETYALFKDLMGR